jgi:hypothetical protein
MNPAPRLEAGGTIVLVVLALVTVAILLARHAPRWPTTDRPIAPVFRAHRG